MIKFLKKLACNHEYVYYKSSKEIHNFTDIYYMHFACKKCEKDMILTDREIKYKINEFENWYKKNLAIGKIKPLDKVKLSFDGVYYCSVGVKLTIDYYEQKGINLKEIK